MKTLYEELLRIADLDQPVSDTLREATRIRANNVYAFMVEDKKDFASVVEHLPVVIPPFVVTWLEFDMADAPDKPGMGYLIIRDRIGGDASDHKIAAPPWMLTDDAVWLVYVQSFSRTGSVESTLSDGTQTRIHLENGKAPVSFMFALREDGTIVNDQKGIFLTFARNFESSLKSRSLVDLAVASEREIFAVVLFALSLLNCKNVTLDAVEPSKAIKHRNRHERPAISYHVLKIRPMSVHKLGGGDWRGGSTPSIHIRRGHFKDYRAGAGLFGKYNEVFWWESEVVGTGKTRVDKEYDVKP